MVCTPQAGTGFSKNENQIAAHHRITHLLWSVSPKNGWYVIPPFIIATILFVYIIFYNKKTRWLGQSFLFSFPGIKSLIIDVELSRFGYLINSFLNVGLTVTEALSSLEKESSFYKYQKFYSFLRKQITDGFSFQDCFLAYKKTAEIIPLPIQQLISAGEQSGTLKQVFQKISETYEDKSDSATKNIATIIEPILLVIVWFGVIIVALAVILPIYSLIGGFNTY